MLHKCDNCVCVRPDHLFLGTRADSFFDAVKKVRQHLITVPKLTADDVREIRWLNSHGYRRLGKKYGVDRATLRDAVQRQSSRGVARRRVARAR